MQKQITGLIVFEELKTLLLTHFPQRHIAIIRFGQKQPFDSLLRETLDAISEICRVDVALASEFDLENYVLSAQAGRNLLSNCYPFLLSPNAANLLFLTGTQKIPDCYRLICYNTAQHVKKKHIPTLCLSQKSESTLKSVQASILSTVDFVEEHVTEKLSKSGAIRVESYFNYKLEQIDECMEKILIYFRNEMGVVKETKSSVVEFIQYMGSMLAKLCDGRTQNFSDFYILLTLYSLYIDAVFSSKRLSKEFLKENIGFALKKEYFDLPHCVLFPETINRLDWLKSFKQFDKLEKKPQIEPLLWVLMLKEMSESFLRDHATVIHINLVIEKIQAYFALRI